MDRGVSETNECRQGKMLDAHDSVEKQADEFRKEMMQGVAP